MRVLLAGLPDILLNRLISKLDRSNDIAVFDGDLRNLADCTAVAACDLLIHGFSEHSDPLDTIHHATQGTWNLLTTTRARRYIQLSSMNVFSEYPPGWAIDENWVPRPGTDPMTLAFYLAEITSMELCRVHPIDALVLRLEGTAESADVSAIVRAVESPQWPKPHTRWRPLHAPITKPTPVATPQWPGQPAPLEDLPIPERVTVFGAGGPLSAATVTALADRRRLLLTDTRSLAEIAASRKSLYPPVPQPPRPPHAERIVDITDQESVMSAAKDADCLVNCSVVRTDPTAAFRVNVLGAFTVMLAAVRFGIRRVVHTGPALVLAPNPIGYLDNRDVDELTPPRPGDDIYFLTKYLAQEICRIIAEAHTIACPILLYCGFADPANSAARPPHAFSLSWRDAGHSMAAAIEVPRLPEPAPVLHVLADSPHGRYRTGRARDILGWQPMDRLDHLWYQRATVG